MKKIFKKNQIIITALAVMIAAAGYISYSDAQLKGKKDKTAKTETSSETETSVNMDQVLQDMENLDFAYAPPFSTAIHPLVNAVNVLLNKMEGRLVSITPAQYKAGAAEGYKVMDVSLSPSVDGAPYVDLTKIEGEVPGFAKDDKILVVCNKGKRAYLTQNRLKFYGYTNTVVLEGGTIFTEVKA